MSSQLANPNTEASILARILQSDDRELSPEIACYLFRFDYLRDDEARVK
jgi:hypothetical protein